MYCVCVVSSYKNINYAINIFSTWCYARKETFKSAALTPPPSPTPQTDTAGDNRCNNPLSHTASTQ